MFGDDDFYSQLLYDQGGFGDSVFDSEPDMGASDRIFEGSGNDMLLGEAGRGSWYSQLPDKGWIDREDRPGSNALGVPDDEQGIALPSRKTLGNWYDVTGPDGRTERLQQTDIGPARWTGRGIDVSAAGADRMGYAPENFPTNGRFTWEPADGPPFGGSPAGMPDIRRALPPEQADRLEMMPPVQTRFAGGNATGFGGPMPPVQPRYGEGQRPGLMGNLASLLGFSPQQGERFSRALAAGLASMKGPGGMAAFAQGFGGAMQGGQRYEDQQRREGYERGDKERAFGLREQELGERREDRRETRKFRERHEDRQDRNQKSLDEWRKRERQGTQARDRRPQFELQFERAVDAFTEKLDRRIENTNDPVEREKLQKNRDAMVEKYKSDLRRRVFPDEKEPTTTPEGHPIPRSKQEYDALPPGTRYRHPADPPGTPLRVKPENPPDA